jgi:hypothetical protein
MNPEQRRQADVLVQWREVERAMEDPAVGQAGVEVLQAEADRLREEYEQLVSPEAGTGEAPN